MNKGSEEEPTFEEKLKVCHRRFAYAVRCMYDSMPNNPDAAWSAARWGRYYAMPPIYEDLEGPGPQVFGEMRDLASEGQAIGRVLNDFRAALLEVRSISHHNPPSGGLGKAPSPLPDDLITELVRCFVDSYCTDWYSLVPEDEL